MISMLSGTDLSKKVRFSKKVGVKRPVIYEETQKVRCAKFSKNGMSER
jgi:hypothetical protein